MKSIKFILIFIIFLNLPLLSYHKNEELSPRKMKKVTEEILNIFISSKTEGLRKYISKQWLDDERLNIEKFLINNYSPEFFNIITASGDECVAIIVGSSWKHLLVFKFTNESGIYRVIPKGISRVNDDYIDPWSEVFEYICTDSKDK